jgi:hypothetical protein
MGIISALLLILLPPAHLAALYQLSLLRIEHPPYSSQDRSPKDGQKLVTQALGTTIALVTIAGAYTIDLGHPLANTVVRVATFFYACKLLDLAVARASKPPTRLLEKIKHGSRGKKDDDDDGLPTMRPPAPMVSFQDRLLYAWRLLAEMRYHSFDITTLQTHRPFPTTAPPTLFDQFQNYAPVFIIPIATLLLPFPELKCLLILLIIQLGIEGMHFFLHPSCSLKVFYRPFSATSLSEFWSTHWQACATSWLRSLAYTPTRHYLSPVIGKEAARAVAVLAVFSLSGIWHAWAVAPVVDYPWDWILPFQVWGWFMSMGFGCLIEHWIWGADVRRKVVWWRWLLMWAYTLAGARAMFRTLQCHEKVGWLGKEGCVG